MRYTLSVGLAAATLAVVMAYVFGAQMLLQSPYAEPAHELFMSLYTPFMQGMAGHASQSQMHGGMAPEPQMQGGPQAQNQYGIIGNNVLGSPAGLAAGGLAAVVVTGSAALAATAFVVSWKRSSLVVAGLLSASGIILLILPLASLVNTGFAVIAFQGPIVGVTVGLTISGLGVMEGIRARRTASATWPR